MGRRNGRRRAPARAARDVRAQRDEAGRCGARARGRRTGERVHAVGKGRTPKYTHTQYGWEVDRREGALYDTHGVPAHADQRFAHAPSK